jgi:glycosyltransferase involved in cell wall biosynthesis
MNNDVCVIIPVYNEGEVIAETLRGVLRSYPFVICVNDGSKDNTIEEISKTTARLVSHTINMGQGAALQTGIEYALQYLQIQYFITFDADGQHGVKDATGMLKYLRSHKKTDIVLGSRFLGKAQDITQYRKLFLRLAVKFSNITTGVRLSDTHNGLRVFNRKVAEQLNITMPDMAHASEIIHRVAEKDFTYHEYPTTITYSEYSKAKGQSMMNAINVTFDILMQGFTRK